MMSGKLRSKRVDELFWELQDLVVAERDVLENLVRQLSMGDSNGRSKREKRPYPKILPKYCNPKNQSETWAGRGKQPRWLVAQLRGGMKLSDFLIRPTTPVPTKDINNEPILEDDQTSP
jgi:DNA-binding protein H-NS